jgi:hypothetical protein
VTVVVYLVMVVAVAAVCCGHQGQPFPIPLRGPWRHLRAPQGRFRDSRDAERDLRPTESRTAPRTPHWAHTQPLDYQEAA